jgi:hypothetical protein
MPRERCSAALLRRGEARSPSPAHPSDQQDLTLPPSFPNTMCTIQPVCAAAVSLWPLLLRLLLRHDPGPCGEPPLPHLPHGDPRQGLGGQSGRHQRARCRQPGGCRGPPAQQAGWRRARHWRGGSAGGAAHRLCPGGKWPKGAVNLWEAAKAIRATMLTAAAATARVPLQLTGLLEGRAVPETHQSYGLTTASFCD